MVISWPPALSNASRLIQRIAGPAYPANAGVCSEKSWVRSRNLRLEPAFFRRLAGQLGSIDDSSLLEQALHVELDRVLAQVHLGGHRRVGQPFRYQTQDLALQPVELRWTDSRLGGQSRGPVLRSVERASAVDGHRSFAGQHFQKVEPLLVRLEIHSAENFNHSCNPALSSQRHGTSGP